MTAAAIDWPQTLSYAQWAVAQPAAVATAVQAAVAAHPVFRNRDFPLSPVPVLIRDRAATRWRPDLDAYVRLLGTVVRLFRTEPTVRAWFGLDAESTRLICADTRLGDTPWVCRLDGYLDQLSERLWILENNADAPAGTLFTARVNTLVDDILRGAGVAGRVPTDLTYTSGEAFLRTLLAAADRAGVTPDAVAVLQRRGAAAIESVEVVAELGALGIDAFLADPREVRVVRGRSYFGDRPANLAWNKVNTVGWRQLAAGTDLTDRWERALCDSDLVHVNPFGARFVAEHKLSLAFVQEPAFDAMFTPEERATVETLLPWARRVTADAVAPDGDRPLVEDLLDRPADYVLKEAYDIRGDGVTIGHDVTVTAWRAAVQRALAEGGLAQRRVRPLSYPVVDAGRGRAEAMPISLDAFMLGGALAGFGAKASRNAKVNIFQGGQKLAVHVLGEEVA